MDAIVPYSPPVLRRLRGIRRRCSLALCAALLATLVPAVAAVPSGERIDGISCDAAEGVALHIHPHLTILDHGRSVTVPEDVGRPVAGTCLYWLHTHTPDGIIHIESPSLREFTLGEFFDIWGRPLGRNNVAGHTPRPGERVKVFVDGEPYAGDPRKIEFAQHLDIAILIGPPYRKPARFTQWNGN